jgi:hypothetical protein
MKEWYRLFAGKAVYFKKVWKPKKLRLLRHRIIFSMPNYFEIWQCSKYELFVFINIPKLNKLFWIMHYKFSVCCNLKQNSISYIFRHSQWLIPPQKGNGIETDKYTPSFHKHVISPQTHNHVCDTLFCFSNCTASFVQCYIVWCMICQLYRVVCHCYCGRNFGVFEDSTLLDYNEEMSVR